MTPHRDKGRGTLVLDRWIDGVGRIKRASGTDSPKILAKINKQITKLARKGERGLRILQRFKARKFAPLEFYDAGRAKDWSRLLNDELKSPLRASLLAFIGDAKDKIAGEFVASASHVANYRSARRRIEASAEPDVRVAQLADVLRTLKPTMKNDRRMFNVVRSFALTFARERFGQESQLWRAIAGVKRYKVKRQQINHPATVVELRDIALRMEKALVGAGKMAWTIATTGLRPKEYWDEWEATSDSVRVVSAKSEQTGREERLVPLVSLSVLPLPVKPVCWIGKFRRLLRDASNGQMKPYDLRRTYANWSEDARVPTTRFRLYFGHGPRSTTDLYLWRDVRPHIPADAQLLVESIEAQLAAVVDVIPIGVSK